MEIGELVNGDSLTLTTNASADMSGIRGTGLYGARVHTGHGSIRGKGALGHGARPWAHTVNVAR